MNLQELQRAIREMVAMAADENRVGCAGGPEADDWLSDSQDAVADGLEAAFDRDFVLKNHGPEL